MKKTLMMVLVIALVLSMSTVAFAVTEPIKATKTSSTVLVDGVEVQFDAYNINSNNYFKLRDLASALNGSNKQFDVTWDGTKNAINLITNKPYTVVGGELEVNSNSNITVNNTNSKVYVNGNEVNMQAYNINGNNYFKLRDLGEFTGFNVDWDGVNNKILIDTKTDVVKAPYTFSQTKLDYPYNIYIENKGYMNFGTAKPFMENGALYLPLRHFTYFTDYEYILNQSVGELFITKYYTEETAYYFNTNFDTLENAIEYGSVWKHTFDINNGTRFTTQFFEMTEWGLEFVANGGVYIDAYTHRVVDFSKGASFPVSSSPAKLDYNIVIKDGEAYWERGLLSVMLGTTMLTDENEKTLYYGSEAFINKKLQELEKTMKTDDSFNNGKTYMETIDDIFNNPVSPWK